MNRREAISGLFYAFGSVMLSGFSVHTKSYPSNLHLIGLGGAGSNMLEYIYSQGVFAKYTCISWPLRPHLPSGISFIEYRPSFQLPKDHIAVESELPLTDRLLDVFRCNDFFILLVGLGGTTGSNLSRQFAKQLSQQRKRHLLICQSPFSLEGPARVQLASETLRNLRMTSRVYSFSLDSLSDLYGDMKIKDVLHKANELSFSTLKNRLLDFYL